ncbi:MAG: hypothetical protein P8Z79_20505 [Sedimentisphaerales bacterium]
MAAMSGTNVQIASNQRNINVALGAALSGQEVMRYWLSDVLISSSTPETESDYFSAIIDALQMNLSGISNITVQDDGSISTVNLDSTEGQTFDGQIQVYTYSSAPLIFRLQCSITGYSDTISRTITLEYSIQPYEFPIFNYGLATKGPLNFPGNPTITGVNSSWEADMFVESASDPTAVYVGGNLKFDGEVNVGSEYAGVDFERDVQIAGDSGQTAIDNHVHIGMDSPEFPTPDTARFIPYATGPVIDNSTDLSAVHYLINATIAQGTNPVFTNAGVDIQGSHV